MVKAALNWTQVPDKAICKVEASSKLPKKISSQSNNEVEVEISSTSCVGTPDEINYLEHVELTLDIDYTLRGALDIYLFSPAGTVSMMLSRRDRDYSSIGFKNWTFSSVHFWGEKPTGKWKVLVRDLTDTDYEGAINSMKLTLHGTKLKPEHMPNGKKTYNYEDLMERAIDKTPEFEEENPSINNIVHDELENLRSVKKKVVLNWADLIGKEFQRSPSKMNGFMEDPHYGLNVEDNYLNDYSNMYSEY
ncbi:hypothetical protein JTE90_016882 [Oedothorax gibbosus]|uniref:P/Homo B domain-containing protein n=1 Tax=Oedothorax gibbosus TaxID=931172 RepID=A0AAV6UAZ7_9ARAC|nr:hypothetical protein JTE90_016882 [Oedothorax gibbosus]